MDQQLLRSLGIEGDLDVDSSTTKGGPGKSTLTSKLTPAPQVVFRVADPETARALGESFGSGSRPRIQREADVAIGARDGNGVMAGAEAAVDRAASSSGAPLPTHLQRQFEGSLGADLSSVRVHTGSESQEAAHAVGAKAYTVGNDIHFAAGRYQPDDPFGMHLLAHEVAHTVQQSGGAQRRQHKLEVSTPQDAAEHEADRAADAMVRGQAATVVSAAGVARKVQREAVEVSPNHPGRFSLPGNRIPDKSNVLVGSTEGLAEVVIGTGAFKDVPDGDPIFASIRKLCASDVWGIPSQTKTENVSTSRWGRTGKWNITITPVLITPAHVGAGNTVKVSSNSSTSTNSGGSTSSGTSAEAGGEAGSDGAKVNGKVSSSDGSSSSHGGGYSGGNSVESEAASQRFVAPIRFDVQITGGWEEGATLSGLRAITALSSFGMSEASRATGEYAAEKLGTANKGPWAGSKHVAYSIEVPTAACSRVW